jgi:hypothetical protein
MKLMDCKVFKTDYFSIAAYWTESVDDYSWSDAAKKYPDISYQIQANFVGMPYKITNFYPSIDTYNDEYGYMFIYGECDGWTDDEALGTNNYYIEKYTKAGKTGIYIAIESKYNEARIKSLK